jgi:hypothetical protein
VREDLYSRSAGYYALGRMAYPPALAEAMPLAGVERALDVGCGPAP